MRALEGGAANDVPLTPLSFLERAATAFGNRTALVHGMQRYTYRRLHDRVYRQAAALVAAGVQPGDRVAVLAPNSPALLESHFGIPLAGAVLVALNIRLLPDDIAYILNHSGAKVLLVDAELIPLVAPIIDRCPRLSTVVCIEDEVCGGGRIPSHLQWVPYELFLDQASNHFAPPVLDEHQPISINYTSGTTGQPKGVVYTHRGAYLNGLSVAFEMRMGPESVYLWTLPMFHCNGWCFPWGVTAAGGTHVTLRKIDPVRVWELIEQEGVTHFCAAPTVIISLAHSPAAVRQERVPPVRVAVGGAPPSPTTIGQMEALGIEITHLYGLTESYGPSLVCAWWPEWEALPLEERARLKARQGVPHVGVAAARVVDEAMNDVPADGQTPGEVVLRSNTLMAGYFNDEAATRAAFRGGWFHTGDIGVMHADRYIELRDRAKDIIISGGENISTIEVEQVILRHPAVLEVAVVGVPDERWGEVPKAFITLKPGKQVTEQEISTFCRQHLAHFKVPKLIEFGELPKTSTGKIQKFVLREREWAGRERRIG